jgi:hypothetical protein
MNPGCQKKPEAIAQLVMVAGGSETPFLKVEIYTIYPNSQNNNCQEYHKIKGEAQRVESHLISSFLYLFLNRAIRPSFVTNLAETNT